MKFFLDTAKRDGLSAGATWGIVDGATTHLTLIAKGGRLDKGPGQFLKDWWKVFYETSVAG